MQTKKNFWIPSEWELWGIIFVILFLISQYISVGQMGGVVADLGRRNGALAQNTIKSRKGFMIKFRKFLELKI